MNLFDEDLLLIASFGYFAHQFFHVMPMFNVLTIYPWEEIMSSSDDWAVLFTWWCHWLADTGTLCLVVYLVMDGFHRVCPAHELAEKPGRSSVMFLLFASLSLWLMRTFQLREDMKSDLLIKYYGKNAWEVVISICAPLVIFFHFHSSVCFFEIWSHVYAAEHHSG